MSNILNYVLRKADSPVEDEYTKSKRTSIYPRNSLVASTLTTKQTVYELCFHLLQALVSKNKVVSGLLEYADTRKQKKNCAFPVQVQEELFNHLDEFLNLKENLHCIAVLLHDVCTHIPVYISAC